MGRDAQLEVDPSTREAVRRLRKRPELLACAARLYSHCPTLNDFTERR